MSRDSHKYFRIEASEVVDLLTRGLIQMREGQSVPGGARELLRLAHTLKGAAHVVKESAIASAAHDMESQLAPFADRDRVPPEVASALLLQMESLATAVATVAAPDPPAQPAPPDAASRFAAQSNASLITEDVQRTVRVDVDEMEQIARGVSASMARLAALRSVLDSTERAASISTALMLHLGSARAQDSQAEQTRSRIVSLAENLSLALQTSRRDLASTLDQLDRELQGLRESTANLRLTHANGIFVPLERAALTTAEQLRKKIRFHTSGGEMRVEAQLLASLRDPLLHVIRNAVAHGIEPPAERRLRNKPELGSISLSVERRGNQIAFVCTDDGAGVNFELIRASAVDRGLLSSSEARRATDDDLLHLLTTAGFTTQTKLTQVAGRGIGLDVVAAVMRDLRGELRLSTRREQGTTVELIAPAALLMTEVVFADVAGRAVGIPASAIRESLRITPEHIVVEFGAERLLLRGDLIPYLPLNRAMDDRSSRQPSVGVLLGAGGRQAAIGVERLLGTGTIVSRPLPDFVGAESFISGIALDEEGNPQVIVDPEGLVETATSRAAPSVSTNAKPLPVLVIDDSLTTRMLEQSILEAAGYRVDLAFNAEDALLKAASKDYGLFLVDVEMPGMNGFEFVEAANRDERLQHVPAILVTSRNSVADRARGKSAGARDYVVKSEFDQGYLLNRIRELVRTE